MQENRITSVTASSSVTTTTTTASDISPTGGGHSSEKASDISSNSNTSTSNANDIDQAQFEADKRAVYKWVFFIRIKLLEASSNEGGHLVYFSLW